MTMQHDQQLLKTIGDGGPFDPVDAIRALARVVASTPAKVAPAAVMDAGPSTGAGAGAATAGTGPSAGAGAGAGTGLASAGSANTGTDSASTDTPPAKKRPAKDTAAAE